MCSRDNPGEGVWDMSTFEEVSTFVVTFATQMLVIGMILTM